MAEEIKKTEQEQEAPKKKGILSEGAIEVLVAIFLGITALLTAWASWIGSLHGGNMSTNYTQSNNLATEGNSMYNEAMQQYLSDLMVWNTVIEYTFDQSIAEMNGKDVEAQMIEEQIRIFLENNASQILLDACAEMTEDMKSPYEVEGVTDKYFEEAEALIAQSEEILEQGKKDNGNGDRYNLVTVIYSVVLFMLGIVGIFKNLPCRAAVLLIGVAFLIGATVFMLTIPMPTGFDFASYFGAA